MTDRWERAKQLLDEALQLPKEERPAFIQEQCADDALLAAEIFVLLGGVEAAEDDFLAPPPPAEVELDEDEVQFEQLGEFHILQEIGRGGLGAVVYLALDSALQRTVALKVLPTGLGTPPEAVDRFIREARAVAKLSHEGIVPIYSVGQQDGAHYFAMEHIVNGDLGHELRNQADDPDKAWFPGPGSPEHARVVAQLVQQVATALHFAHVNGIVHRDVKPQNLMIADDLRLMLVDFGLAKDEAQGSISRTGVVQGTPYYMSPEQALAKRSLIDERTDVYSLGCVLYEMLTLVRPFRGTTHKEIITQIIEREPVPVGRRNPDTPHDLEVICSTAMAKRLEDRYASAEQFAADLGRFLAHEAIRARPLPARVRVWRAVQEHRWRIVAGIGALLLFLAGMHLTSIRAAESERKQRWEGLAELVGIEDWDTVDAGLLLRARGDIEELLGAKGVSEYQLETARTADELMTSYKARALEGALDEMEQARRSHVPEEVSAVSDNRFLSGFLVLTRIAQIFPEDTQLQQMVRRDTFYPRVTLRALDADVGDRALSGTVSFRVLDQLTGAAGPEQQLGAFPLEQFPVPPGFYRFIVRVDGWSPRELTRLLWRGRDPDEILCRFREEQERAQDMVRIEGDVLRLLPEGVPAAFARFQRRVGLPPAVFLVSEVIASSVKEWPCPNAGRAVAIETFWLDAKPVSIAQYRRFLNETGRPEPLDWLLFPAESRTPGSSTDDLPAVGMSWYEARDYAEWAGKRLVGHAEWELAARGASGAFFSVPTAAEAAAYQGAIHGAVSFQRPRESRCLDFLNNAQPVDAATGLGRNGLYHMYGNTYEHTESLGYDQLDAGGYSPRPSWRIMMSSPWYARADGMTLATHQPRGPELTHAGPKLGFRCASSFEK